jgi:hypothetical protein
MSGAPAYLGLYFLCFLAVGALFAIGTVLYVIGKRRERRPPRRGD